MKNAGDLQRLLKTIDRRSYPAYKETKGTYRFEGYVLSIDHVQGDPFAAPSKVSVLIDGKTAGFPKECYSTAERRISMQDYLLRIFGRMAESFNFKAKGSGKSGLLAVSRCGQEILERTACSLRETDGSLTVRMEVGFPAHGRTICSGELEKIFFEFLPKCVQQTLFYKSLNAKEVEKWLFLADDRSFIRRSLPELGLVAFVANGSILPRESGVSDRPMKRGTPFVSPKSMEVTLELPHKGPLKGMGIKRGVTLVVGGGYHGKSTLLRALELGVYDHIAGDGREFVITDADAVKIRAEDGRSVVNTNISMFINDLPNGKDTVSFSTEDASGSTSQAANVVEAVESGASALLIDEDTSATNFMVRDALMQRVVVREKEPITPFIDRIRLLYEKFGISTVLVAGSSGAFFDKSDTIIQMDQYLPREITEFAKAEAEKARMESDGNNGTAGSCLKADDIEHGNNFSDIDTLPDFSARKPAAAGNARGHKEHSAGRGRGGRDREDRIKVKAMGRDSLSINKETVILRYLEQLVDMEQTTALGYLLAYAQKNLLDGSNSMTEAVDKLLAMIEKDGLTAVLEDGYLPSGLAMPRREEIFACFNRYRSLV